MPVTLTNNGKTEVYVIGPKGERMTLAPAESVDVDESWLRPDKEAELREILDAINAPKE